MKEKDLRIISCLRKDGRQKLSVIARKVRMPVSTAYDRYTYLKEQELIHRFTCIVPYERFGFHTRAVLVLKAKGEVREGLQEYLEKHIHVNSLFKINRNYHFLCDAIFQNMRQLEEFLEVLETKFSTKTEHLFYVIQEVKAEQFLADPNVLELLSV